MLSDCTFEKVTLVGRFIRFQVDFIWSLNPTYQYKPKRVFGWIFAWWSSRQWSESLFAASLRRWFLKSKSPEAQSLMSPLILCVFSFTVVWRICVARWRMPMAWRELGNAALNYTCHTQKKHSCESKTYWGSKNQVDWFACWHLLNKITACGNTSTSQPLTENSSKIQTRKCTDCNSGGTMRSFSAGEAGQETSRKQGL